MPNESLKSQVNSSDCKSHFILQKIKSSLIDHGSGEWETGNCKMKRQALIVWEADCWAGATSVGLKQQQKCPKNNNNRFLCTFSGVLDSGPDTSSAQKTGTNHGCWWEDESRAVLHTGKWHPCKHQGFCTSLHLSCPFFLWKKEIN